jgi:hypothetical protein
VTVGMRAMIAAAQDSVAYVTQKSGPPATETYMWAGYAITLGVLFGYVALMASRISKSKNG